MKKKKKKDKNSFQGLESNPEGPTCVVNALLVGPGQLTLLPMKFCRSTLFEADRALSIKNWNIHSSKTSRVLTVKTVLQLIWSHFKTILPTSVSQNCHEDYCSMRSSLRGRRSKGKGKGKGIRARDHVRGCHAGYMSRINYDSATVNIHSVFIEQRNISFQNDISLKTMRLGVLSWEKLKNRETHGRIVSLDQLGSRRAIADLFVMFIAWTSQKASKVHKLLSQSWP